jgi:hypothetical protein
MKNMKKLTSFITIFYLLLCATTVAPSSINAQTPTPNPDVTTVSTETFEGEIVRVESNKLIISSPNETKEFTIPENATVKRNTFEAPASEIQPGDDAKAMYTQDGQILSLEVTSGEVMDWSRWMIPALVVGLVLVLLAWKTISRSNKSHIKTTTE